MIKNIYSKQKKFFESGKTRELDFRIETLKKLKNIIKKNEADILNALQSDLGKSEFEGYSTEIGLIYDEINLSIKNIRKWSKIKKVKSPIIYYPSKSYIYKEPYGVTVIIGPFNYPFQLVLAPLIGAIAAGNTAMIKPSESTVKTAKIIEKIINNNFSKEYLRVVNPLGGKETVTELVELPVDYIFFTGSVKVGKIIMEKASKNLTPLTLELGGKSPCIVDKDAKLEYAAKRIVWGKLINAGQTCIAPDYLYVHKSIKNKLLELIVKEIKKQYGENLKENKDYPRIVNRITIERLEKYISEGHIYFGGDIDKDKMYMEPTILTNIKEDSKVMEEEIFGPILPVIEFQKLDEVISYVTKRDKPLALYYFSESKSNIEKVLKSTTAGGVTINDTIIHVANPSLPFGGVGSSGMGKYHGKASFDTFSHEKSVMKRGTFIEFEIRFAPFEGKIKLLKKVMK